MADAPEWMKLLMGEEIFRHPVPSEVTQIPAWRELLDFSGANTPLPADVSSETINLPGPAGRTLSAEVYRPATDGPHPLMLYLHGGGWCVGSAASVRRMAMLIAAQGYLVVNLDYSLAPEAQFPVPVEDCLAGAWWCAEHNAELGGDGGPLLIAGDSAGANLAAAVIIAATDTTALEQAGLAVPTGLAPEFAGALFNYGVFDFPLLMQTPGSYQGSIEVRYNMAYLGNNFLAHHWSPFVSPIFAPHLERFPPTYLTCGNSDDLLGHTLAMSAALAQAGVATRLSAVPQMDHAFLQLDQEFTAATAELNRIYGWLEELKQPH